MPFFTSLDVCKAQPLIKVCFWIIVTHFDSMEGKNEIILAKAYK
jgi:hypothetical protein